MCSYYLLYGVCIFAFFFFFFQAEDGIRDADVTGVQTCALPILPIPSPCLVSSGFVERYFPYSKVTSFSLLFLHITCIKLFFMLQASSIFLSLMLSMAAHASIALSMIFMNRL